MLRKRTSKTERSDARSLQRPTRSLRRLVVGFCLGVWLPAPIGCAATPKPTPLPAAPPVEDDRQTLFAFAQMLGMPPPSAHANDPLGQAIEVGFEKTQVELAHPPALQQRSTRAQLNAFRNRVAKIEVGFPGGCDEPCATSLEQDLKRWLGQPHIVVQGNARLVTFTFDTTEVALESYPKRAELTRLVLTCRPLMAATAGRGSRLPRVGQRPTPSATPTCRGLPSPTPPVTKAKTKTTSTTRDKAF